MEKSNSSFVASAKMKKSKSVLVAWGNINRLRGMMLHPGLYNARSYAAKAALKSTIPIKYLWPFIVSAIVCCQFTAHTPHNPFSLDVKAEEPKTKSPLIEIWPDGYVGE